MRINKCLDTQLRALGITVERLVRNKHTKLYVRNLHGCTGVITMSATPGDHRSLLNTLADLRRFARLTPATPAASVAVQHNETPPCPKSR